MSNGWPSEKQRERERELHATIAALRRQLRITQICWCILFLVALSLIARDMLL